MTTALVRVQALRRYSQRSYVTADTSCTEIDQQIPVKCNQRRQDRHHNGRPAPVNNNDVKHWSVKVS